MWNKTLLLISYYYFQARIEELEEEVEAERQARAKVRIEFWLCTYTTIMRQNANVS